MKRCYLLHDTTSMDCNGYQKQAVGYLHDKYSKGIWLHHGLLLDEQFKVLGLFESDSIVREVQEYGKKQERKQKPLEEKESYKWIRGIQKAAALQQVELIHVADREADVGAFLEAVLAQGQQFVIRSAQDRKLWADSVRLFEQVRSAPAASITRQLRDEKGKFYPAECFLHYASLEITCKHSRLPLQVVYLKEKQGEVAWLLLTSLPVGSLQEALSILDIYQHRWLIEEYHKCLKTGCLLEKRQVNEADNLYNMIALLQITAVKLLQLKQLGLEPTAQEATALQALAVQYLTKAEQAELTKGTPLWTLVLIARLGGHQGLKQKGMPGWQTLWKGWQFFQVFLQGFAAAHSKTIHQTTPVHEIILDYPNPKTYG